MTMAMDADEEYAGMQNELGGSIKVDNVQALAASHPCNLKPEILERYIRPEIENDFVTDNQIIPVVDMQRLFDLNLSEDEASKLKFACEEWGFFQLVNHDIPNELIEKVKADVEDFFRLPLHVKEEFSQEPGNNEGYGQAFVVSEEQKLDWGDMLFFFTQPKSYRNLRFWPTHPSTFRETMDKYSLEVRRVAHRILGIMEKNLELEHDKLVNVLKEAQSARINYYPPCPMADKVLGLSPHSDAIGLTLLLQVSQVPGLQIRRNGRWVTVKPIPGAFIVNIGDMLEVYTNGKYKSIEHRAVVHPKNERISIASFHSPKFGELIGPLPEIVRDGKELYRTLSFEDFLKLAFSGKLEGKSLLDCLRLNVLDRKSVV